MTRLNNDSRMHLFRHFRDDGGLPDNAFLSFVQSPSEGTVLDKLQTDIQDISNSMAVSFEKSMPEYVLNAQPEQGQFVSAALFSPLCV